MGELIANVSFEKVVQYDSYEMGCSIERWSVANDNFSIKFTDVADLKKGLAEWVSERFDVNENYFIKHVENECDNNRFDYSQNEDEEDNYMEVSKDNPDGYLADYSFYVTNVLEEVDYKS